MSTAQATLHWTKDKRFMSDFTKISLLFWGMIALINYFQDVLLLIAEGNPAPWSFSAVFCADWPLWALLTPFILRAAIRYPITLKNMYFSFSRQFILATLFVFIHTVAEFLVIQLLIYSIFPQHSANGYLPGYFMASVHSRYIVYFLLSAGMQRFDLYSKFRHEEVKTAQLKEQLITAQLESLRMQLQPHFLFNAHHTIAALLLKKENDKASSMLMRLSNLLRKTLEKSKAEFITISQEMEMINLYISIQQIRFADRLRFVTEIDPQALPLSIPSFLLQPLIENAIIHGIEPHVDQGEVKLIIKKIHHHIVSILIINNGVRWSSSNEEHTGLSNTRLRLDRLYGQAYLFKIGEGEDGTGTKVTIELPLS